MPIGSWYDPLLAKVVAWGADREQARRRLLRALRGTALVGVTSNLGFLARVLESDFFIRGETFTTTLESLAWVEPPQSQESRADRAEVERRAVHRADPRRDRFSPWSGEGFRSDASRPSSAARPREGARAGSAREIRAPMTGRVVKISAAPGSVVKANEVVVVLEAMKMEYRLAAPRDGEVESVFCKEGDLVDLGRTLAVLKP